VDGVKEFDDGMQEMLDGVEELNDAMLRVRDEGIHKIADIYRTNIKSLDESLMEIKDAAKAYKTFSGALENADNNVRFIIKTDGVEVDEEE
jgi:exonuclease VII small subunit